MLLRPQEILSDARVVASQLGGRGGRVRDEAETASAKSLTVTNDGEAWQLGTAAGLRLLGRNAQRIYQ